MYYAECGADLKSTNFVFRNIRQARFIDEINLKYTTRCCLCLLELRSTLQVALGDKFIVDSDPNGIHIKRKARECSISLPGLSNQNNSSVKLLSIVS